MALIIPPGWREVAVTGAAQREIETLAALAAALPDDYTVYHGVHWTRVQQGVSVFGDIDFIVVAPDGRILIIEQKSGFLTESPQGLVKQVQGKARNVATELTEAVQTLILRFAKGGGTLAVEYLLYCPDYRLKDPASAGVDPARIVDAARRQQFAAIVRDILPLGLPDAKQHEAVERFLRNILELIPDASAMIGSAGEMVTRLSGGLATWARQLEFSPFRLRVVGTAGSGKTQLALAEFHAAIERGERPLYVCYNRPLADHVRQLVPPNGRVTTFHTLCDSLMRENGKVPDYTDPGIWQRIEHALQFDPLPPDWQFDVLVVDEGQDFSEAWREAVLRLLKPDGRAIWLEDPLQNLYGRAPAGLEGWVTLHADANYRSPRQVVELLRGLAEASGTTTAIDAASPFLGADIEIFSYPDGDTAQMLEQTKHAITRCLAAGFARPDIALISYHGRERSALLGLDRIGPHTLKSFTGTYDWFGSPVMREGELLVESVYRFKGQSAPAVIFTEIDFAALDERVFRKLFVGLTRAKLKLVLVVSESARQSLAAD